MGLRLLESVTHEQGELVRAAALMNESLKMFQEIGDRYGAALALCSLAILLMTGVMTIERHPF
jgi:hypothetical protein